MLLRVHVWLHGILYRCGRVHLRLYLLLMCVCVCVVSVYSEQITVCSLPCMTSSGQPPNLEERSWCLKSGEFIVAFHAPLTVPLLLMLLKYTHMHDIVHVV